MTSRNLLGVVLKEIFMDLPFFRSLQRHILVLRWRDANKKLKISKEPVNTGVKCGIKAWINEE